MGCAVEIRTLLLTIDDESNSVGVTHQCIGAGVAACNIFDWVIEYQLLNPIIGWNGGLHLGDEVIRSLTGDSITFEVVEVIVVSM